MIASSLMANDRELLIEAIRIRDQRIEEFEARKDWRKLKRERQRRAVLASLLDRLEDTR